MLIIISIFFLINKIPQDNTLSEYPIVITFLKVFSVLTIIWFIMILSSFKKQNIENLGYKNSAITNIVITSLGILAILTNYIGRLLSENFRPLDIDLIFLAIREVPIGIYSIIAPISLTISLFIFLKAYFTKAQN
jgi:hypothetical protein